MRFNLWGVKRFSTYVSPLCGSTGVCAHLLSRIHESIHLAQSLAIQVWRFPLMVIPWSSILRSLCSFLRAVGLCFSFFPWADSDCNTRGPFQSQSHFECFDSTEMNKHDNHRPDTGFANSNNHSVLLISWESQVGTNKPPKSPISIGILDEAAGLCICLKLNRFLYLKEAEVHLLCFLYSPQF